MCVGCAKLRVAAVVMRVWCASAKSRCCVILLIFSVPLAGLRAVTISSQVKSGPVRFGRTGRSTCHQD